MSEVVETKLKFIEGYQSRATFDLEGIPAIIVDEPKPVGEGLGPGSTRLLSAAVGHCLASSLIYCLRRARIEVKGMETTIRLNTSRNEEGRLRVMSIDVEINLDVSEGDRSRIPNCIEIFENYCTVTSSIRRGIDVKVRVV